MEEETRASGAGKMPYEAALLEVVKGLHRDPVLLFGIGAGIVLLGALAITSSLTLVLVVAGVLVAVLFARAHQRAQAIRRGHDVKVGFSRVKRNKFRVPNLRLRSFGSSIEDNEFGSAADPEPTRPPER